MTLLNKDQWIEWLLRAVANICILIVLLIFLFIGKEAFPFVMHPGPGMLFNTRWNPTSMLHPSYGVFPLMTGTLVVTVIAGALAIPFGVYAAAYIGEVAGKREKEILKPFIELLAGIPSVVIGFFGLTVLGPMVKDLFHLSSGLTALTGGVLLALMASPTIISISEDALRSVPLSYKEASLSLGATPLETLWRVLVPAALPGIFAAVMLGMGRVIGETMAVLMVTGNAAVLSFNIFGSVRTMTATIAAEMGEVAFGTPHYQAIFCVGILLLLATFGLNMIAQRVLSQYRVG